MPIIFIVQLVSIALFIILSAIEARLFMPGHYFDNHLKITEYWAGPFVYPSVSGSRKRTKVEPIDPYDKQCINASLVYHAIFIPLAFILLLASFPLSIVFVIFKK